MMTVRFATKSEIARWDDLIIANPDGGNAFSGLEFARQKETGGYKARFLMVDDLAVTVLEKNGSVLGKLWYLPKGPNVTSTAELFKVLSALDPFARRHNVFAIRIETELDRHERPQLEKHGLARTRPIIPNPSTIVLDISPSLDDILQHLPQKGRYAIRRAQRDGVTAKPVKATKHNCQIMYKLLEETARGQFGIRSYDYFQSYWQRFERAARGQLFFAYYQGQVVAGAYAMIYGSKSTYKDGASVRQRTAYGASHLLQWRVIEWAKDHGASLHDLCGSPPSEAIDDPAHPHHGIGLFKTAFARTITDYIGCYDYIIHPIRYKIWIKFVEKVAMRLHFYRHHDSYF